MWSFSNLKVYHQTFKICIQLWGLFSEIIQQESWMLSRVNTREPLLTSTRRCWRSWTSTFCWEKLPLSQPQVRKDSKKYKIFWKGTLLSFFKKMKPSLLQQLLKSSNNWNWFFWNLPNTHWNSWWINRNCFRLLCQFSILVCEISEDGGVWTIKTSTTLKTMELKFKLGEPFDETTPDGREVTAVCTLEDGKIVSVQKAKKEGQKSTKVRWNM